MEVKRKIALFKRGPTMNEKNKQETKTTMLRNEDVNIQWFELDATGKTLGRFCSEVAKILRGKHKVSYTPHIDMGDGVIVVNAEKIVVTGNKKAQKLYRSYTGYMGGLKEVVYRDMLANDPEEIIRRGVKGMMPKSRLGDQQIRKLRVVKGDTHSYQAQKPIKVQI